MEKERCDNCLYEYACDWNKAGDALKCEDWKPEDNKMKYCPACGRKIKVVKEKKLRLEDVTRCPYCNYIPKCNEQTCKDCKVYEDFLDDADDLY